MRHFRFRLDPVIRLKNYQIERKEEEIADLEDKIQQQLQEIEAGRQAVQDMRQRLMEETDDTHLLQAERSLDMFRSYTAQVEMQKRQEIGQFRQEQEEKRKELVKLYQEEKILERLKERRKNEWETERRKEDAAMMDEIGTQKYVRRSQERGGIMLYLLSAILLAGIAAAVALLTGVVDKSVLDKIPYIGKGRITSATETVSPVSATDTERYVTPEDLFGPIDAPMPQVLENIARERERLSSLREQLQQKEEELEEQESLLDEREEKISGMIQEASTTLSALRNLQTNLQDREKSALSQREQIMADSLAAGSERNIAQMAITLFQAANAQSPEEEEENKLILIRILRKMEERARNKLLEAISKADPNTGAEILKKYVNTDDYELYDIDNPNSILTPTLPPGNPLPPPVRENIGNGTGQPGGE